MILLAAATFGVLRHFWSDAAGVGHIRAAIPSGIPPCAKRVAWSPVVGVGHIPSLFGPGTDDPDAVTEVRRANGGSG